LAINIKTNVSKTDENHRSVEFTVSSDDMGKLFEKNLGEFRKQVSMKGFRPGQVPKQLFLSRFGDEVWSETISKVVEGDLKDEFEKIVETWKTDEKLEIAAPAEPGELLGARGEDLVYKLSIALNKPIVVQGYKDLGISVPATVVAEEEVKDIIQGVRKRFAKELPVTRPSKFGDVVKGKYLSQMINGTEKPLPQIPDFEIEISDELDLEELKSALIGLSAGEEKNFTIHYPETFAGSEYKGKTVDYKITVSGVYELELPAENEEFYSMVGATDEADFKSKVTDDILRDKKQKAILASLREALDRVIEKNPFPVLEEQIKYTAMRSMQRHHHHHGHHHEEDEEEITLSEEQLNEMRPEIIRAIQEDRILRAIVEQEGLKPTQGQVDTRVKEIAKSAGMPFETVKDTMRKNGQINRIRENLKLELAQNLLIGETLDDNTTHI